MYHGNYVLEYGAPRVQMEWNYTSELFSYFIYTHTQLIQVLIKTVDKKHVSQ